MKLIWAILGLVLPAAIQAVDLAARDPELIENVFCLVEVVLVDLLRSCSTATQFCESVLASTETATTTVTETSSSCAFNSATVTTSTQDETTTACTTADSPYPTPADLLPYPGWEITGACSCLCIPATDIPTVTVTDAVTTTTTLCPIPSTCGNEGLQWAYYQDNSIPYHGSDPYLWDPSPIKTMTPGAQGNTTYVFQNADLEPITIYGSSEQVSSTYYALNHRGYLYAEQSGNYTFTGYYVDDEFLFWAGPLAYSGWNGSNYNAWTYSDGPYPITYTMSLLSGQYFPIRLVYANGQGASYLNVTITAPDGTAILDATSAASPYIVQYSCDGTSAPAYPPFGQET